MHERGEGETTAPDRSGDPDPDPEISLERAHAYWRANLRIMGLLLCVWFLVSYGLGILWVEALNRFHIGGFPLGFWFAQQGSIYVFIVLIAVYVVWMDRVDARFHLD
jgi:putative solute:sodium symporter small subunit